MQHSNVGEVSVVVVVSVGVGFRLLLIVKGTVKGVVLCLGAWALDWALGRCF